MYNIIGVTLVYLIFLWLIERSNKKAYTEWDNLTTTISDYTMRYKIPKRVFEKYRDEIYKPNSDGLIYSFKGYLTERIEEFLRQQKQVTSE